MIPDSQWHKFLKSSEVIYNDLNSIRVSKREYYTITSFVRNNLKTINSKGAGRFFNDYRKHYSAYVALCIRRHSKPDKKSHSLVQIVDSLHNCSNNFTFSFYCSKYPIEGRNWQSGSFRQFSVDGSTLSKQKLSRLKNNLLRKSDSIVNIVDRELAHKDQRGTTSTATFDELFKCLEYFHDVSHRVFCFLHAVSMIKNRIFLDRTYYKSLKDSFGS